MALCSNGVTWFGTGIRHFGATAYLSAFPSALHGDICQAGRMRNITAGEGITDELVGIPSGYRHPGAWMMPQKPGALAARNTVSGSGGASATAQSGYNIDATITGAGDIPGCDIGLIISIAATLTASGGISSAATEALAGLAATLTGTGDISATAAGLATLGAALVGSGAINPSNTALMDVAATIRGYGDLTPEGLRDAVWNAVLANYAAVGSAGFALSTASSGGVDLNALATAVWGKVLESSFTAEEMMRILAAGTAGQRSGVGTATETYKGLDGTTVRIEFSPDANGNGTPVVDGT